MVEVEYCDCCGQKIRKLNPHRMCKKKVAMLEYISMSSDNGAAWVEIKSGRIQNRGFNGDEQVFAMRLGWFGLVEYGERRSGLYKITPDGINFLLGLHRVPKVIWCQDGKVIEKSPDTISIEDVKNVVLDKAYWDNYATQQKSLKINNLTI